VRKIVVPTLRAADLLAVNRGKPYKPLI
jgi:hypothetical protein